MILRRSPSPTSARTNAASRRSPSSKITPVVRVIATILAGLVVLFVMNTARSDSDSAAGTQVSTSSLLTLPGAPQEVPTSIPTSAPVQFPTTAPIAQPTATSLPTSTAVPTSVPTAAPTSVPLATPTAAPTSVPAPQPEPEPETTTSSAAVAGQSAVAPTEVVPNPVIATATAVPNPVAPAEAVPNPVIPTATAVPNPVIPTATAVPNPVIPSATATPIPVQTVADLEAFVLGEINGIRARAGLSPLALDPGISATSRDWSRQMAAGGFFRHRPGNELNVLLPPGWREWGENIASAPDIFWAQSSLESSPGHFANMVGNFTHVGIGVYSTGSQVWLTQNFVRY